MCTDIVLGVHVFLISNNIVF